jgi:uncharacterized protein (DUF362 family)
MSLVSLVRFDEQTMSLQEAIEKSLNLINFQFSPNFQKVAIKPNLCYYWDYSTGETTDPRFVSALIDVIRFGASPKVEISVVESDASAMKCEYSFRMLGYEKMAREKGVKLVNLTNDQAEKVKVIVKNKTHEFSIPKTIADADILIDVPKIKYMLGCKLTCALKNIYGCNPYPKKHKYHKWLDETIVSLNKIMKPELCIMDGIVVKGVKTLKLGLIIASKDPVAMDAAASEIAGINPHSVKYLELASKEKIGNINFIPKGEPLEQFKKLYPRKNLKYRVREILSALYSHFFAEV